MDILQNIFNQTSRRGTLHFKKAAPGLRACDAPIRTSGGLNLYRAFGNNPVNFIDPWGVVVHPLVSKGKRFLFLF